jgi:hypothetical protein
MVLKNLHHINLVVIFSALLLTSCKLKTRQSENITASDTILNDVTEENISLIHQSTLINFSLPENKYEISYIKSDSLFFYDIESQNKKLFPEPYPVFNMTFTPDGKTMYYTVFYEGELFLKVADFLGSQVKTTWLLNLERNSEDFVTQTYSERSRIIYYLDTVYIENEYEWLAGFNKCIIYSTKDSSALFDQENKVYSTEYSQQDIHNKHLKIIRDSLVERDINGVTELFYKKENDSIQLTQTKQLDDEFFNEEVADEYTEPKSFIKLGISADSSNLLIGIITTMGDLAHGPYFLVNLDGKGQVQISEDGFGSDMNPQWLPDRKNIATIALDHETDDNMLNITQDNYKLLEVDRPVSYMAIRNIK